MFFSDRYKRLLFEFAAEDSIEAVSCDALDLRGRNAGPYWWLDVIRVIDAVDEDRSTLTRQIDNPFSPGDEVDRVRYMDLQDVRFRPEIVGDAHIFRLSLATQHMIIDGALADRIRASELSGVVLTPLQPPLPAEQADHWRFKNYPHWTSKKATP